MESESWSSSSEPHAQEGRPFVDGLPATPTEWYPTNDLTELPSESHNLVAKDIDIQEDELNQWWRFIQAPSHLQTARGLQKRDLRFISLCSGMGTDGDSSCPNLNKKDGPKHFSRK